MFEPTRRCNQCREMKYIHDFRHGKCGDCKVAAQKEADRASYRLDRIRHMLRNAKGRAARAGRPFDLDAHIDDLRERLSKGVCELTGLPFNLDNEEGFAWDSPSLDRVDSTGGYTYGNVRMILYGMNAALGSWGEDAFRKMAEAYVRT